MSKLTHIFFPFWHRNNCPVRKLREYSHRPGNEYSLAKHLVKYIHLENLRLTNTVVFPGCGSGAYELAFLLELKPIHRFSKVIMMDNKLHLQDCAIWNKCMPTDELIIYKSFEELVNHLKNNNEYVNVIFFHKAKHIESDQWYIPFINACRLRSCTPYIHAFNNRENQIYSSKW